MSTTLSPSPSSDRTRQRGPACDRCRNRKQKCDRVPIRCSNCRNADTECLYPPGKGRAPKRPRTGSGLDPQLTERLSRLEHLVRQAGVAPYSPHPAKSSSSSNEIKSNDTNTSTHHGNLGDSFGRLVIDDKSSYYVNNVLWSTLANQVKELTDVLLVDPASADEGDCPTPRNNPINASVEASNAAILGYKALSQSLRHYHPSLPQAATLFAALIENVMPVVHIFHMPTLTRIYWDAIATLDTIDRDTEALLFAVNYAAVVSIDPDDYPQLLGITRDVALDRYRFATEQALARAGLLTTQSIRVLQAAVIFLTALRNQDESRTTWSLSALVYHIAQAMGLHRDGQNFGLKPYETEVRRRLWWYICILDTRSSEYHGYEPIVTASAFDTKCPLHINDEDLIPDMEEPPPERTNEATDMTFTLIRCEAMKVGWKMGVKSGRTATTSVEREQLLKDLENTLEEKYVRYCDNSPSHFQRFVSAAVARLIIARFWLVFNYQHTSTINKTAEQEEAGKSNINKRNNIDESMRDRLFHTCIQILDISAKLLTDPQISRWAWYSRTHIQWGPVGFVLSELCTRPLAPESDKAWRVVKTVYEAWRMRQNTSRGTFSLPIQRLMAKASHIRQNSKKAGDLDMPLFQPQHDSTTPTLPSMTTGEKMARWQEQAMSPDSSAGSFARADDQMLDFLGAESFMNIMPDMTSGPNAGMVYNQFMMGGGST